MFSTRIETTGTYVRKCVNLYWYKYLKNHKPNHQNKSNAFAASVATASIATICFASFASNFCCLNLCKYFLLKNQQRN